MTEHILITLIPGSQHHQLHILGTQLIHNTLDQIQALLVCKAGYDSHHELLVINLKSQLLLEGAFVLCFLLAEVLDAVLLGDESVCLRVKVCIINTIDNAAQAVASGPHQAIQPFAVEGSLDLLRIGLADRGHRIGEHDAALKHVAVLVSLQLV